MKKIFLIVTLIVTIGLILGTSVNVSAEENRVPEWVKNTAAWWAMDQISETEFLNAIEFLANQGIIKITESSTSTEEKYMTVDYKFSILQPPNWERQAQIIDPNLGSTENSLVASGTATYDVPTKIKVSISGAKGDLEEHNEWGLRLIGEILRSIGGEFTVNSSGNTTIDNEDAVLSDWSVKIFGTEIKGKSILVIHRGDAYSISYEADKKNFDEHIGQFEEMVKTFKFL
jgi:hypothetical protein